MNSILLDVNFLLALAWPNHQFCRQARKWFQQQGKRQWCTCTVTQIGFVRISSNPVFTPYAKTALESTLLLNELIKVGNHRFIEKLPSVLSKCFETICKNLQGHKQITDAFLIALATTQNLKLVTFDKKLEGIAPSADTIIVPPIEA